MSLLRRKPKISRPNRVEESHNSNSCSCRGAFVWKELWTWKSSKAFQERGLLVMNYLQGKFAWMCENLCVHIWPGQKKSERRKLACLLIIISEELPVILDYNTFIQYFQRLSKFLLHQINAGAVLSPTNTELTSLVFRETNYRGQQKKHSFSQSVRFESIDILISLMFFWIFCVLWSLWCCTCVEKD